MDDDWLEHFEKELVKLRGLTSAKVSRVKVDQIERLQEEKLLRLAQEAEGEELQRDTDADAERICLECVEVGDLNSAFATVLRYVDLISQRKTERCEMDKKASRTYSEQLFQKLGSISRQQIDEATEGLQEAIDSRLTGLEKEFGAMAHDIGQQMCRTERVIAGLEVKVSRYGMLMETSRSRRTGRSKESVLLLSTETEPHVVAGDVKRRRALRHSLNVARRRTRNGKPHPRPRVGELQEMMVITGRR